MIVTPPRVTKAGDRTRLTAFSGHPCYIGNATDGTRATHWCRPCLSAMTTADHDTHLWDDLARRAALELAVLPTAERAWIATQLTTIAGLQETLHGHFLAVDGAALCSACRDRCCGHGKYHLTLVNLLAYLTTGEGFPVPDFVAPCPMLAEQGCRLPPARRPFNCVTFICGAVEEQLSVAARSDFYATEQALRQIYESFDRRYAGSSLRGLLNRGARLGSAPLFAPAVPAPPDR